MILPTARTVWIAALAAPTALVIAAAVPQAWAVAPAAVVALVALAVIDALLAGRIADWKLMLLEAGEVGVPMEIGALADFTGGTPGAVSAVVTFDPRLGGGGRAIFDLAPDAGVWRGTSELVPTRRGTAPVERLALQWTGPLGLGARTLTVAPARNVAIRPDLSLVRSPALAHVLRDAQIGLVARRVRGEGTQFEALSEYAPGMDRRRIDWKTSSRHTRLYARENEAERNNQIVLALDCGQAMCEPVDGLPRIDRAVGAALACAFAALKGGDRVSLFAFARRPEVMTPFYAETRAFRRLQQAAAGIDYHAAESNFTLALATLSARLERRSLVVLFSEITDPAGAELMVEGLARLAKRHRVLFVSIADTELAALTEAEPTSLDAVAVAVSADALARQRALVLERLRQLGVEVIEAPWQAIGFRLVDRYLAIKAAGAIG